MIYAWAEFVNVCQLQFNEQEEPQEIGALQDRAKAEQDSEAVSKLNLPPVSFDSIRCGPLWLQWMSTTVLA